MDSFRTVSLTVRSVGYVACWGCLQNREFLNRICEVPALQSSALNVKVCCPGLKACEDLSTKFACPSVTFVRSVS